jgi:hypothetical protein
MQAAQNLAVHEPVKLYRPQSGNLSTHRYRELTLSFSPRCEKLKKILTRARVKARNAAITPHDEIRHAGPKAATVIPFRRNPDGDAVPRNQRPGAAVGRADGDQIPSRPVITRRMPTAGRPTSQRAAR